MNQGQARVLIWRTGVHSPKRRIVEEMHPSQLEECEEEDGSKLQMSSCKKKPNPKYVDGDFVEVICNIIESYDVEEPSSFKEAQGIKE